MQLTIVIHQLVFKATDPAWRGIWCRFGNRFLGPKLLVLSLLSHGLNSHLDGTI